MNKTEAKDDESDDGEDFEGDVEDNSDADQGQESDSDEAPELVSAKNQHKRVKTGEEDSDAEEVQEKKIKVRSDGIEYEEPELELDMKISDGDFTSDSDVESDQNPHNFVHGEILDTYKRSRMEKKAENLTMKSKYKKENKHTNKTNRGTTNKEKNKNKPMQMVKPKKIRAIKQNYRSTGERMKELKTQLGKIRQGKLRVKRKGLTKGV